MRVFQYKTVSQANKKRSSMKKAYGYTPTLIKVRTPRTHKRAYLVVKPSGLKRI
jgi:hypothetical protein